MKHVDPSTTHGGGSWSATAMITTLQGTNAVQCCEGVLPPFWHLRQHTVLKTGRVDANVRARIAIIGVQRRWRHKQANRAVAKATARRNAAIRLQAAARGRIARHPAQCLICLDCFPFAAMISTVASARCHRVCRRCAQSYVNSSIEEGKLFIRCPGESCRHLMSPEQFASDSARATYRANMRASHQQRLDGESDTAFLQFAKEHTRMCPACGVVIWRYAGCDHMSCRCGHNFDWGAEEARVQLPRSSGRPGEAARPSTEQGERHSRAAAAAATAARENVRAFRSAPHNARCFDCGAAQPAWTSLTLCTAICLECAGAHRALGTDRSRVRSFEFDVISAVEAAVLVRSGGNEAFRDYLFVAGEAGVRPRRSLSEDPGTIRVLRPSWRAMSIEERYNSAVADQYRRRIRALWEDVNLSDDNGEADDRSFGEKGGWPLSILELAADGERARAQVRAQAHGQSLLGGRAPATPHGRAVGDAAHGALRVGIRDDAMYVEGLGEDVGGTRVGMLEGMQRLVMMGFDPTDAMEALERHGGDVQRAALAMSDELDETTTSLARVRRM